MIYYLKCKKFRKEYKKTKICIINNARIIMIKFDIYNNKKRYKIFLQQELNELIK